MKGSIACGHRDGLEKMKEAMQPQLRREERNGHREEDEGGRGKGIDGEKGRREDHDWMEEGGRGKDERSNVTHLEGKRGGEGGGRGEDNRRRKGEKGEEGRRLDGKTGNTKGVIGPKERAKVGGRGKWR